MLVDLSIGEEEKLRRLRESQEYGKREFGKEYYQRQYEMSRIVEVAKIYILDNYEKIKYWDALHFNLYGYGGKDRIRLHFGMKDIESKMRRKKKPRPKPKEGKRRLRRERFPSFAKAMKKLDDETIQVRSIERVVYDWTDGDFSIRVNGTWYNWINHRNPEAIIEIAHYIEENLKKE